MIFTGKNKKVVVCLAFDACHHGERKTPQIEKLFSGENLSYPEETGLDFWLLMHECIVQTYDDLNTILHYLKTDRQFDLTRLGVTGFSMGACAAFYLASRMPQIRALLPISGVGMFARRFQDILDELDTDESVSAKMAGIADLTEKWHKYMHAHDPFPKIAEFCDKPVCIICGEKDIDQPKHYSVAMYKFLKKLYANSPGNLQLKLYDAAHELTPDMIHDACSWFQKHIFSLNKDS